MSKPRSIRLGHRPSLALSGLLTSLCLVLATGCSKPGNEAPDAPAPPEHPVHHERVVQLPAEAAARAAIRSAAVEARVLDDTLETTGQVDFDQDRLAHVSPRISGRVHQVHALLGQRVGAGKILAEIDSVELGRHKAEFLQAKAREDLARQLYERERQLFEEGITPQQRALSVETELREATAALRTAEETLHLYGLDQAGVDALGYDDPKASIHVLRAPFPGTIVERHATLGELVTPERNLFTLADLRRLWIWIDVYQRDLGRVHLDDRVEARVDAYPGAVFTGTISYLSAQVDPDTRTLRARLDVDNPAGQLRPGMFVDVKLSDPHTGSGNNRRDPSLVVPTSAIVRDGDELAVFVVAGPGRFERRVVHTGRSAGGTTEVLDGVELGTDVVVEGAFLLKSAASKEAMGQGHEH